MDQAFLEDRIAAVKRRIIAYEEAIEALASGKVSSYTLDTGQTREVVQRKSVANLQKALDSAMNTLTTLEARRVGAGVQAIPGW